MFSVSFLLLECLLLWAALSGYIDASDKRHAWLFLGADVTLGLCVVAGALWMHREILRQRWREDRAGLIEKLRRTAWYGYVALVFGLALFGGVAVRLATGSRVAVAVATLASIPMVYLGAAWLMRGWDIRTIYAWCESGGAHPPDIAE
jgi:hypothetical protein